MPRVLALLLPLLLSAPVLAEDWPTFRHNVGRTAVTGESLKLPLERVWTFRSRTSRDAPACFGDLNQEATPERNRYTLPITAAGDALFFTSAADGRVVCLDAASGAKRWEFVAGLAVNRCATFFDGRLTVGSDDGNVYCLDAKTGKPVWTCRAAPADRFVFSFGRLSSAWPVRSDVPVDRGVAYFGCGVFPHDGTFLYALDAKTGRRIWRNGSHCETLFRWSLVPRGHLWLTDANVYVPMGMKAFRWAVFNSYRRDNGLHDNWAGSDPASPGNNNGGDFAPLAGAVRGPVRFFGDVADVTREVTDPKTGKKTKKTERLWTGGLEKGWQIDHNTIQGLFVLRGATIRYDPNPCSVIVAGNAVFYIPFRGSPKGVDGRVVARDAKTGKELWSAAIEGWPRQVIAANGRLFVSTRSGAVHAFAPKDSKQHGVIEEPVDAAPFEDGKAFAASADAIIQQGTITEGYAVVLDCTSGALAHELAKRTKLHVSSVFADGDRAAAARRAYVTAGMHLSRLVTVHGKPGEPLPFPSRFADLIVSESAVAGGGLPEDVASIRRLLKPIHGRAVIGGPKQDAAALKAWAASTKQDGWAFAGHWATRTEPRLEGAGGWSHGLGSPGHTMNSHDAVLKGPLGVIWYGAPYSSRASKGISPPIIMDGVLVTQYQNIFDRSKTYTVAHDQYTGRELWKIPHSMTDTCAAPGSIFQRYMEMVVHLEPWTGRVIKHFRPLVKEGRWHGMAAAPDGETLYLLSKAKDWSRVLAVDVKTGNVRWTKGGPDAKEQWGGWAAISDGRLYFVGGTPTGEQLAAAKKDMLAWLKQMPGEEYEKFAACIDKHSFTVLKAVDGKTGEVLYARAVDTSNAGGGWTRHVSRGHSRRDQANPIIFPCTIAHGGTVIFGTSASADKYWAQWPGGGYKARALSVYDGKTGRLLWYRFANYRARPVVTGKYIAAEPWAFELRTGEPKTRRHPITGETARWAFCRYDKQCGAFSGSEHFIFGRSRGIGYHDLLTDRGLYTFMHSRASCWVDTSSGGGTMIKPPHAIGCRCEVSLPYTIAMAEVPQQPAVPQVFAQPGEQLPVLHLRVDVGATGDRRDADGNLWLQPRGAGHYLLLGCGVTIERLQSKDAARRGGPVRRSAVYTPIENTDAPFLFASAERGLTACAVPLTKPEGAAAKYRVRLGFAALPADRPGRRLFHVKLNGKPVLRDFDIVKEAGKPDRAIWKEFTIQAAGELKIEFVAAAKEPAHDQMPLLNAVEVLRKE
jgi:outer membrane protein assembly factor BamB